LNPLRFIREWISHRRQIREHRAKLQAIPAPPATEREIEIERMPYASHSLTQKFIDPFGRTVRQDCTVIQSAASIRHAISKAGEV
jgi:hypothetical protein